MLLEKRKHLTKNTNSNNHQKKTDNSSSLKNADEPKPMANGVHSDVNINKQNGLGRSDSNNGNSSNISKMLDIHNRSKRIMDNESFKPTTYRLLCSPGYEYEAGVLRTQHIKEFIGESIQLGFGIIDANSSLKGEYINSNRKAVIIEKTVHSQSEYDGLIKQSQYLADMYADNNPFIMYENKNIRDGKDFLVNIDIDADAFRNYAKIINMEMPYSFETENDNNKSLIIPCNNDDIKENNIMLQNIAIISNLSKSSASYFRTNIKTIERSEE